MKITNEDNEIIKAAMKSCQQESDVRGAHNLIGWMMGEKVNAYSQSHLNGKPLYDIGCGYFGYATAEELLGLEDTRSWVFEGRTNFEISKVISVDPFVTEDEYKGFAAFAAYGTYKSGRENLGENIEFVKMDGLSFLLHQEDCSANVMTSSLDCCIIRNNRYAERLAEEIYRVVPKNGIYVSFNSHPIEYYAGKIFERKNSMAFEKV